MRKRKQSFTIKDVPGEYAQMFGSVAAHTVLSKKNQHHTDHMNKADMTPAEKRVVTFCEVTHQMYDSIFGEGAGDRAVKKYQSRLPIPPSPNDP